LRPKVKVVSKIRKTKQERSKRRLRMLKMLEEFLRLARACQVNKMMHKFEKLYKRMNTYLSETKEIKCNAVKFLSENWVSLKILLNAVKKDCRGKQLKVVWNIVGSLRISDDYQMKSFAFKYSKSNHDLLRNLVAEGIVFTEAKEVAKNVNLNDGTQSVEDKSKVWNSNKINHQMSKQ